MKNAKRFFLIFAFTFYLVSACSGQLLSVPLKKTNKKTIGKATLVSNNDSAYISSEFLNRNGTYTLKVSFTFDLTNLYKPVFGELIFEDTTPGTHLFSNVGNISVFFRSRNGAEQATFPMKSYRGGCTDRELMNCREVLTVRVPFEFIQNISNAESGLMNVGDTTFELTKDEIGALTDVTRSFQNLEKSPGQTK